MGRFTYEPSLGPAQYRRSLYAFWRRTSGPTFLFDSSPRRRCEVIPRRTNTPLQALTLLNDRTALEAARQLSDQMNDAVTEQKDAEAIKTMTDHLWKRVLSRTPRAEELAVITAKYQRAMTYYRENPQDAAKLLNIGQRSDVHDRLPERAAAMLMANLVLNLDEAITHE